MSKPVFVHMYALKDIRPLTAEIEMGSSFCGGLEDIGFYADRWFLFFHQSGTGTAYYEESEMKRSARVAFERYCIPSHRRHFSALVQSILAGIGEYIELVASKDLAREEPEVLLSLLEQGWDLEARAFALYNTTQPQNSSLIEAAIKDSLSAITESEERTGEALAVLTTPDRLSKIGQEELDLLELVIYIQEHEHDYREKPAEPRPGLTHKIAEHLEKYKTLMLGEGSWRRPQVEDLYKSIDTLLSLDAGELRKRRGELRDYSEVTANSKRRLARELGLSDETLDLCDAAAFIGYARLSLRIDGWVPLIYYRIPISRELARRKELNGRELMFQTRDEFLSLFRGRPLVSLDDLAARAGSDTYLMMVRDRNLHFYYGDEAREMFATMAVAMEPGEEATIQGAPAMKGKVVGRVLVYGWGDDMEAALRQMTPDTILVAGQTRPQLMPLVRQAKGIVTDEGGIMGHAAVVARELRIPCVVGAKIATQRLRTGDLIELDATVGLVKILPLVIPIHEEMALRRELAGGKGASLGTLARAGLPVPSGFVVTSPVYQAFHQIGIAGEVGDEILAAFDDMQLTSVAVRSSALVEDSAEASWAGQFESYLGIDRDHLLGAIQLCWKSAHSAQVQAYARDHSVGSEEIVLAVVVQEMVDCDVAGVVFTKNPVTDDKNELMIEACYGLGEMLVQGLLTPDNYIVQKEPLRIKSTAVSEQSRQMRLVHGRVEEVDVDSRRKNSPKLTEEDILSLSRLALQTEALYGVPQDIEWGLHHGTFYILQARPVTT